MLRYAACVVAGQGCAVDARIAPAVAALGLLVGCTHAPSFEREGQPARRGGHALAPPPVAVMLSTGTYRLRHELEDALAREPSIAPVGTPALAEYIVRVGVERHASGSPVNFWVCWPGFVVFAPGWHGLVWSYALETRVAVDRADGERIAEYALEARWTASYTSMRYGLPATLGWVLPLSTIPALQAAIASSVERPDTRVLDTSFAASEGPAWASEVIGSALDAIERDQKQPSIEH